MAKDSTNHSTAIQVEEATIKAKPISQMNPFDALATFVLGKIKEGLYVQWLRFLFEMAFSMIVSFLFVCGTVLVTKAPRGIAIGSGMIMSALSATYLFRREQSKLTRGMLIVLPSDEATKEIATGFELIQKAEDKKS